jgi:predicted RNA-binding Zn-ribbon protein involved in translation (DUF1610 family)
MAKSSQKRKTKKRQRWVRVCPKCNSTDTAYRGMIRKRYFSNTYFCRSCGFHGPLFPEITAEEAKKLPHKPRKFNPSQMPVIPRTKFPLWIRILFIVLLIAVILFGFGIFL